LYNSGHQEIRLLWLRPAELIECDLQVFPLKATPEYVVQVSDGENASTDHIIICKEKLIFVTKKIYFQLRTLCSDRWQVIWISDLCVDQSNLEECANQMKLKTAIFENSKRVFMLAPRFHYSPIPRLDHIRLLEILSVQSQDALMRFRLRTVSLADSPSLKVLRVENVPPKFTLSDILCSYAINKD
jgi:hypothetical protein